MKKSLLLLSLVVSFSAMADDSISVINPWTRPTVKDQPVTGVFLTLKAQQHMQLISASTTVAATTELHEMKMDGNIMKMREMDKVDLPAGKEVAFAPGGMHLMLKGLKQGFKEGDKFVVTLVALDDKKKKHTVEVSVQVAVTGK